MSSKSTKSIKSANEANATTEANSTNATSPKPNSTNAATTKRKSPTKLKDNYLLPNTPANCTLYSHVGKTYNFPPIDITNDDLVKKRIKAYFNSCSSDSRLPSITGLSIALNVSRRALLKWSRGELNNCNSDIVSRACTTIEMFLEDGLLDRSINPIVGFFLLKNNFGYDDTTPGNTGADNGTPDTEKTAEELIQESFLLPDDTPVDVIPTGSGSVD